MMRVCGFGLPNLLECLDLDEEAGTGHERRHEVHCSVDQPPGQVAADRACQHGPEVFASRVGHPNRPGEGEDHDDPEQDLRRPVERIEHALRQRLAPDLWSPDRSSEISDGLRPEEANYSRFVNSLANQPQPIALSVRFSQRIVDAWGVLICRASPLYW